MSGHIVDVNVSLSRWPFRRLPLDNAAALVDKLAQNGVAQAWCGSFDALLHQDISAVNERLAQECRRHGHGILLPFGSVNPMLPDWETDLKRCRHHHKMRGIRLHPNYHGYKLSDAVFVKLLRLASEMSLIVQITASMEDRRTQHPLVQTPDTDLLPLAEIVKTFPETPVVLLNCFRAANRELLRRLANVGNVFFEISTLEGAGGLGDLLNQFPRERLLFGSGAPFFYFESALLKLKESALTATQAKAICEDNARRLLEISSKRR